MRRELAGEVIAGNDDADRTPRRGIDDERAGADELAAALERLVGRRLSVPAATRAASRSAEARRCPRGSDGDCAATSGDRRPASARQRVDLDESDTPLAHFALDRSAHGVRIATLNRRRRHRAGQASRVLRDHRLVLAVVVAGDPVRRRQHVVNRLRHPFLRAASDQLAADDQHQHRRDDRQPEQREHELGAEARERQAAAPLDDQLDDVARQDEHQREQHREVGGRERVEHDLGEEVRVQLGGSIRERDHRDEGDEQDRDAEEDQPGIVAKGAAFLRRRCWPGTLRAGNAGPTDLARGRGHLPHLRNVNLARPATSLFCHGQTNVALRGVVRARTRR